jgi:hypothetical protein
MSDNETAVDDSPSHIVLDTEKLMCELEKRPALYKKKLKEYSDRNLKEKLWGEGNHTSTFDEIHTITEIY